MTRVTRWRNSWQRSMTTISAHQATVLQVAGLAAITGAGFALAAWLGLLIGGVLLCLCGWAVDG